MDGFVVTVERTIPAPPEAIFALVADAARHPDIDGSGTVIRAKGPPERLKAGSTFAMSMKMGIAYSMVNTVVEYEEDRLIAWQGRPPGLARFLAGGRIWRYELEPVEGGTRVRESWDISADIHRMFLRLGGLPGKTRANMERTLARIEELTASED